MVVFIEPQKKGPAKNGGPIGVRLCGGDFCALKSIQNLNYKGFYVLVKIF